MNSTHILLVGAIVREPEYRENKVNTLLFTLAGDQVVYHDNQEAQTKAFYLQCRLKNRDADHWRERLKADMVIGATGRLEHYRYTPAGQTESISNVDVILSGDAIIPLDALPEDFVLDRAQQKRYRYGLNEVTITGRVAFPVDFGLLEDTEEPVCNFLVHCYDDRRETKHYFEINTRGVLAESARYLKPGQSLLGRGRFAAEKKGDKTYHKVILNELYPGAQP